MHGPATTISELDIATAKRFRELEQSIANLKNEVNVVMGYCLKLQERATQDADDTRRLALESQQ